MMLSISVIVNDKDPMSRTAHRPLPATAKSVAIEHNPRRRNPTIAEDRQGRIRVPQLLIHRTTLVHAPVNLFEPVGCVGRRQNCKLLPEPLPAYKAHVVTLFAQRRRESQAST